MARAIDPRRGRRTNGIEAAHRECIPRIPARLPLHTRNASCTRSCDAQNKSTRRYNVSDACTRIRCQRTPLVFQRGYRCCHAATIPPVTSDDLRAVRDGNLGSRPSEGRLETFSTCARHFRATKGRRRSFRVVRDENSTRRDLKVCAKIMDKKVCIKY